MSANIKASVDGTQAIIGVGGVDQMTVSNAGVKNKEAWLTYRQALRDIPSTFKTPEEVVWPEAPNK